MVGKTYRTALRDKLTAYYRVIQPQPIVRRSGDTLNRIECKRAGSLWECNLRQSTFKLRREPPNTNQSSYDFFTESHKAFHVRCRTNQQPHLQWIVCPTPYKKGILLHGGPPSDFRFRLDEYHKNEGHMVRVKTKPRHAAVRPPKCVVYMSCNPITYSIHRHRKLFQKDEDARVKKKQLEQYKKHVHTPPAKVRATTMPQEASHC